MSDAIQHECGIAVIRLLQPYAYYVEKYGSPMYPLQKMYLMLEKQRNRGQDGVGVAAVKLDVQPGYPYHDIAKCSSGDALKGVFADIEGHFKSARKDHPDKVTDGLWVKQNVPFAGELLMGHLRYGTHGRNDISYCHPFVRQNNWMTRNLLVAGNFNMTNNDELLNLLIDLGQHPTRQTDTVTVLEKIGHFLDEENDMLQTAFEQHGMSPNEIMSRVSQDLDIARVLQRSTRHFDGGYVIGGLVGNGDCFVARDPSGIRPAFYHRDEEVVVVASERPAIQTVFDVKVEEVQEIKPGHALIVRKNGRVAHEKILEPRKKLSCSFERIYFSRGGDKSIYAERKALGGALLPKVLDYVGDDLSHAIFSYIPNTSEVSFYGLIEALHKHGDQRIQEELLKLDGPPSKELLDKLFSNRARVEKMMSKDVKLRTFIAADEGRGDMVSLAYDTTYGLVENGVDTVVLVDDSIVRGTTLRKSILSIVDRLGPKRIIVCSSAPQIRYPDCYGIDMSKLKDFAAFEAAIYLIRQRGMSYLIDDIYRACKKDEHHQNHVNHVQRLYEPFSVEEISEAMAKILSPDQLEAEFTMIFQSIEGLHSSCPNHLGDWYFTGNYPTAGGNRVVNRSFINFYENNEARAY